MEDWKGLTTGLNTFTLSQHTTKAIIIHAPWIILVNILEKMTNNKERFGEAQSEDQFQKKMKNEKEGGFEGFGKIDADQISQLCSPNDVQEVNTIAMEALAGCWSTWF